MWEERYAAKEYAFGKLPNDFLLEHLDKIVTEKPTNARVLCLAEGEGRNAVHLARHGFDVVAVDSSNAGMLKAQQLAAEHNVSIKTVVADLAEFDFEHEAYDVVVSIFCHLPVPLRQQVHNKVVSALKPGGLFLLEAYTPDQLKFKTGGPAVAELTVSLDDLLDEVAGLEVVFAEQLEREVIEGLYHTGMGAVVQLVGRKNS